MTDTAYQPQTGGAVGSAYDGQRVTPAPGTRSSEQIRQDIVRQRQELSRSVDALRTRWGEITNVGNQIRQHKTELIAGAALVGFVVGGIVALSRRRGWRVEPPAARRTNPTLRSAA